MKFTWLTVFVSALFGPAVWSGSTWTRIPIGIAVILCASIDYPAHLRRAAA